MTKLQPVLITGKNLDSHVCISVKSHCDIIPTVGKFHNSHSVFVRNAYFPLWENLFISIMGIEIVH